MEYDLEEKKKMLVHGFAVPDIEVSRSQSNPTTHQSTFRIVPFDSQETGPHVDTLGQMELEALTPSGLYSRMNKLQGSLEQHVVVVMGAHSSRESANP